MRPEEIVLVKSTFTSIQKPEKKENLRFLLLVPIFLYLLISPGAAASSSWELIPEHPIVGDIIEIRGTGFEGEAAEVRVTFEKEVQVSDGKYEYLLENVKIPSGFKNSFTVQATGADNLNVRAKTILWITKSAEAKDGVAVVSQTGVPEGTYEIRIDGKSSASNVKLKITAFQQVEVDSEGDLSYLYSTESMPAGSFEVKIGDIAKQIDLQSEEALPSEITPSSEQNSTENTTEQTTGEKEVSHPGKHVSGNISPKKNKTSSFTGISSILEIPKAFLFEDARPYIQAKTLVEIIKHPPKVPSFLLGFAGALLIGFAIMRKKK